MQPEEVIELISKSAARLTDAVKRSSAATVEEKSAEKEGKAEEAVQEPAAPEPRDERWWASLAKEDWNLIKLSWELRGVILRRERPQGYNGGG